MHNKATKEKYLSKSNFPPVCLKFKMYNFKFACISYANRSFFLFSNL